jgi:hypothetical protein
VIAEFLDAIQQRLMKFVGDQAFQAVFGKADAAGNLTGGLAGALGNALGISLAGSASVSAANYQHLQSLGDSAATELGDVGRVKRMAAGDTIVHNYSGTPVTAKSERVPNARGGEDIHVTVERLMANAVARGGDFTNALEQRYPLSVAPRHR